MVHDRWLSADISRDALIAELGYTHPEARAAAIEALVAAGLTNARKTRISSAKKDRCREVLAKSLIRLCSRCENTMDRSGRRRVPCEDSTQCDGCSGSTNLAALREAWRLLRERGMRRVVVVGGGPGVHKILRDAWPEDLKLRIVEGDASHTAADARAQLQWADVIAVWGSTILAHRVSALYTRSVGPEGAKVFLVPRRGVEALAEGMIRNLSK